MVEYSLPPEPRVPPPASPRLSKFDALKTAASNPAAVIIAIGTAIGAITTALKTSSDNENRDRASYETLRVAVERNERQIAICRQEQINSQGWVEDLAARIERKQVTVDKAVARARPKTAAPVAPFVEEIPKPPEAAQLLAPSPLPPFDGLGLKAQTP